VQQGDPLFTLYASDREKAELAKERLLAAHKISADEVEPLPLFYGTYPEEKSS
jgi:thymidine phosphorylase